MTRFILLSVAASVLLGLGTFLISQHVAHDEAVRDARTRSRGMAEGIAAPLVDSRVRAGDPAAMEELGTVLENRMRDGSVTHMLLWDRDGRVIWADDATLIGRRFDLVPEVEELFDSQRGLVQRSDRRDESAHPGRQNDESLLEVYIGTRDLEGVPFVFEAYIPPTRLNADRNAIIKAVMPVAIGGLLLFQLAVLPLAFSLARRVDRARLYRSEILGRSLTSWHHERRRLAQELHDGVIQDLSAASYALPSVIASLPPEASANSARKTGRRINSILQEGLQDLRTLIMDLLPSDLEGSGLQTALQRLAARSQDKGSEVELDVQPTLDIDPAVAGLVYRVVREGLRNVDRHARARNVSVTVIRDDAVVDIQVADDGRGMDGGAQTEDGHFGLHLLRGLMQDVGGTIGLRNRPGGGALLHARIPAVLPE